MVISIDFTDKVVLVTGGTKGIGRGVAARFAEAGAQVAVFARRPSDDLPAGWSFYGADLRVPEEVGRAVSAVVEDHGRLDVLINNAGGSPPADTATSSARFVERVVALNLLAAMWCSQAAKPHLGADGVAAQGGGAIVNISSVAAIRPAPTVAAYGAAKAALCNYTRTVGQEWAPRIRTNCVVVGMVRTSDSDGHLGSGPDVDDALAATIPMQRLGTPRDVADACLFLCSPLAAYISGAAVVVDGGGDRPPFLAAVADAARE